MSNKELEKDYLRCFDTAEGRRVLEHLRDMTLMRVLSPDAGDTMLWYLEGQRQLVSLIGSMIERARKR